MDEYTGDYNELLYLRARYYAPGMGRFTTKDSWQGDINGPLSLNRWMYVEGNPINYIDPSGHCSSTYNRTCNTIVENAFPSTQPSYILGTYERFDITLDYMYQEMITNSKSQTVIMIRDLLRCSINSNGSNDQYQGVSIALFLWAERVAPHRPWDHKPKLERKLYLAGDPSTSLDDDYYFPIRGNTTHEVYYDIWSNIHYGFVGLAAGFPEQDLQSGAAVPFLAGANDPGDVYTINMGFELWKKYSTNLTMNNLHQIILDNINQLTTLGKAFTPWTNGW